ncbi:MAG: hydantoinase B/oxoprolinase family protein [Bacteroidales bacterium]|nr:MAG: hydantoinase B/oxoprolinase family protein [Bacteroidales bacterium]
MNNLTYDIYIDTGGTFTDCLAYDSNARILRCKVLSSSALRGTILSWVNRKTLRIKENWDLDKDILAGFQFKLLQGKHPDIWIERFCPEERILHLTSELPEDLIGSNISFELISQEEAPVLGIRLLTGTGLNDPLPDIRIKLGSTKGTNALLEKKGARIAFFVTRGFRDIIEIGTQQRPDIFARNVRKRIPLYETVVEVDERISAEGEILKPLQTANLLRKARELIEKGIYTAAVVFMNSYRNPVHEQTFKEFLFRAGFRSISVSSELTSLIKFLPRAETTVVNAYLQPVISDYLENVVQKVNKESLYVMTSAGGLVGSAEFRSKDSLLSGPAGGVVGASAVARNSGYNRLITFDMGGTSTDVARYDKEFEYRFELEIGDAHIFSPALCLETVAAGGGSICFYDGFKLCVGPESAGAVPGPACYGVGGPLTLTDVNLLAGRLDTGQFGIPVFPEKAESCLADLITSIEETSGKKPDKEDILQGFLQIANEIMASAIRKISVASGYDPADYTLVAFGGAGGLHACAIAELLHMRKILIPVDAGLLSAFGLGNAVIERFAVKQLLIPYEKISGKLNAIFRELEIEAIELVAKEGIDMQQIAVRLKTVYLRFEGQDSSIEIPFINKLQVLQDFRMRYEEIFGHWSENRRIELESVRVIASAGKPERTFSREELMIYSPEPSHMIRAYVQGDRVEIPVYIREEMSPGATINGFALLLGRHSTSVIQEDWEMQIDVYGSAVLQRSEKGGLKMEEQPEYIYETELELFTNRFRTIAENMGSMLQRTSLSVNVKERLDFSCALLDAQGRLVTNAPHIPVHLGSLGLCVRTLSKQYELNPGDTLVTNHPKYGGSHLPDITLVTPVFTQTEQLIGYVVNRAHHAEIGGKRPGSMPPDAANLVEEGVIIKPYYLVWNHIPDFEGIRAILQNARFPSRSVEENLADLNAALAANRFGSNALVELVNEHGLEKIRNFMEALRNHAADKMSKTLAKIPNGIYQAEERLDDGTSLMVKVNVDDHRCSIDFTGTGGVHKGNMNATRAIVNGVVIYVLRLLIDENIPLNDGILEPVDLIIPKGLLDPGFPDDPLMSPAIVGGNVELSQRLTDTLLKAFGIMGCSQGTMNNVLFGNDRFSYYETICGGCGAGKDFNGTSAVHHHMTNTRITDPEILELRYPVILEQFKIRKGSGGKGRFSGGDGVIRKILFLEDVSLSVLTQHRIEQPYGMLGGEAGKRGSQMVVRSDRSEKILESIDGLELKKGDRFIIKTPGGGGYGKI